jgi:hypothetical protein
VLGLLLMLCSWRYFPWDLLQRFGAWALKAIDLLETPALFCGLACAAFCVPAASELARLWNHIKNNLR